jgi:Ca2+-binding EF-hand superfamily protein
MVVTNQDQELKSDISQRKINKFDARKGINKFVERELVKLFVLLMETIKEMIFQVEELRNLNIDFTELCESIDNLHLGFIDKSGLFQYLKNNASFYISQTDLNILLNKLDHDRDGKVSFYDLSVFFFLKDENKNVEVTDKRKVNITDTDRMRNVECMPKADVKSNTGFINLFEKKRKEFKNIDIINKVLISYFKSILDCEIRLEGMRKKLNNKEDLVLRQFLYLFPITKGFITAKQFYETLNSLNIFTTEKEAQLVFFKYDSDGDCLLSIEELATLILSKNEDVAQKFQSKSSEEVLSEQNRKMIVEFLRLLLNIENKLNKLQLSFRRDDVKYDEYFAAICNNIRDYITLDDVNCNFYSSSL